MITMSHPCLLTGEFPALSAWNEAAGQKLPRLRDVDSSYYLRQEEFGLNLGPYEVNCMPHCQSKTDPVPEGNPLEVEIYGLHSSDRVQPDGPIYNPKNERLRA